jgi:predicted Rossmann fold flavoprotein
VILCEKTRQILSKVRISGGGRCNVTHSCFDPALLVQHYPRGGKELRGAFTRFQPRDTIAWFESRGVQLKTEQDGRIFPVTDSSETIIQCLLSAAAKAGVEIRLESGVIDCEKEENGFALTLSNGEKLRCNALLVAAGGNFKTNGWIEKLGHTFVPPVPSLFTFHVPHSPLHALAGVSLPRVNVWLEDPASPGRPLYPQTGALLLTHVGFSGPAILRLSAWAARYLHEKGYKALLRINWLPDLSEEESKQQLLQQRAKQGGRLIQAQSLFELPKSLWKTLVQMCQIPPEQRWSMLSKIQLQNLIAALHASPFEIVGKSLNKEEFVTCGGVKLEEVDFKTMQSRLCPGLYFAGEVLDIDGVTGGFNFQNAWTTSWIAGTSI